MGLGFNHIYKMAPKRKLGMAGYGITKAGYVAIKRALLRELLRKRPRTAYYRRNNYTNSLFKGKNYRYY
jgi:hypothetical protein